MHTKLVRVFALTVVLGMASCKTPVPIQSADGSIAAAAGGGSTGVSTGGSAWAATGGTQGSGGSAGGSNATTAPGSTHGTGGDGGGSTRVSTGGSPSTGGGTATAGSQSTLGSGGSPAASTGGVQGKGGNGTGGSVGAATGGAPGPATSTPGKSPLELVPLDDDVPGWIVDRESSRDPNQRAMTATTYTEAVSLIDGWAEVFYQAPNIPKLFLWQNYLNSDLSPPDGARARLFIFVMPSAAQAKGLYMSLQQTPEYARKINTPDDWRPTTVPIGTESRIQDTGVQWWINFYSDVFYVEVLLDPSYGPPPDYMVGDPDTQQAALRFAQAIASRI